jgi:hypothetical protein
VTTSPISENVKEARARHQVTGIHESILAIEFRLNREYLGKMHRELGPTKQKMASYGIMSQQPVLLRTVPSASSIGESLSKRLLGLDWREHTPRQFDDITVVSAPFEALQPFVAEHYAGIFETESGLFRRACGTSSASALRSSNGSAPKSWR